jgi:glycosyltransferase involved in cell wall biosynthesis
VKIAFLNPSGQLGGAERSLLDILASLRAAEPDWALELVATSDGPLVERAKALGVGTTVLALPSAVARLGDGGAGAGGAGPLSLLRAAPAAMRYAARLRATLRAIAPDVVHSNGFKMHVLGLWTRPADDFVGRRPVMSALLRAHAGRCAAVIANSRSVAEDVEAVCRGRVRVHPVYNAIDLANFRPDGPALDLDRAAGVPSAPAGTVRVGLVATLGWWKGHETFLRAVARLPRELAWRAYVVGGALYETAGSQSSMAQLRALAGDLGIAERVAFTGFVDDAAAAMRALDVVVHASTEPEPFGLVIVEAMASGRAVIVSEAGGAAELISPDVDALAHPPGDVAALARRIETVVRDGDLRARLGLAGRATAERRFDRAHLAAELTPIYRDVTRRRDR